MVNECCVCNSISNSSREKPIKMIAVRSPVRPMMKQNVWVHPMCVLFARASNQKLSKINDILLEKNIVSEEVDY